MPLPSQKFGALQCSAKSKRSGVRCLNNAVSSASSNVCRMHGYVPKEKVKTGSQHPNWKHGERSNQWIKQNSAQLCELRNLENLGYAIGIMSGHKWRGRKPRAT